MGFGDFVVLIFLELGRSRSRGAGWHRAVSIPPLVAHVMPGTDRSQLPGTCLGSGGLAALGAQQVPPAKVVNLHKIPWFAQVCESLIWSFWHVVIFILSWTCGPWCAVSLHLRCSAFMDGIVWAEFGLRFLPQVGAEWFYRQHQHPAALLVLHPQNTFHAYCPFSSGLKPMALFHPWGSRAVSNLKTEDTVGITQV